MAPHLWELTKDVALVVLVVAALVDLAQKVTDDQARSLQQPHPAQGSATAVAESSGLPLGIRRTAELAPVFSAAQTSSATSLRPARLARCPGAIAASDGLGPSAHMPASLVLGPDADVLLLLDQGRVASLRTWFAAQPHSWRLAETPDTPPSPCLSWPQNDVPWRSRGLLPVSDSLLCATDVVGTTCQWRTDWSLVACHPDEPLCACPSRVVYGSAIETLYLHNVVDDAAKTLLLTANSAELCAVGADTDALLADTVWTAQRVTSACSVGGVNSYCDRSSQRRVRQTAWALSVPWPPASYLPALRSAFSARTALKLHIDSPGCQGGHGWVSALAIDGGTSGRDARMVLQCFWKAALNFAVMPAEAVALEPLNWHAHGAAFTLVVEGHPELRLSNWCVSPLGHLRSCLDPAQALVWVDSSTLAQATLATDDAIVDLAGQPLPAVELVLDDWY